MIFNGNTLVLLHGISADISGGGAFLDIYITVVFKGNSTVKYC